MDPSLQQLLLIFYKISYVGSLLLFIQTFAVKNNLISPISLSPQSSFLLY